MRCAFLVQDGVPPSAGNTYYNSYHVCTNCRSSHMLSLALYVSGKRTARHVVDPETGECVLGNAGTFCAGLERNVSIAPYLKRLFTESDQEEKLQINFGRQGVRLHPCVQRTFVRQLDLWRRNWVAPAGKEGSPQQSGEKGQPPPGPVPARPYGNWYSAPVFVSQRSNHIDDQRTYAPPRGINQTFEIALWLSSFANVDLEHARLSKLDVQFPAGEPITDPFGIRNFAWPVRRAIFLKSAVQANRNAEPYFE